MQQSKAATCLAVIAGVIALKTPLHKYQKDTNHTLRRHLTSSSARCLLLNWIPLIHEAKSDLLTTHLAGIVIFLSWVLGRFVLLKLRASVAYILLI